MDVCCTTLRSNSRRYYPKLPEAEQSDALVQFGPMDLWFLWMPQAESHSFAIYFCPWCGTELSTLDR